MDQLKIFIVDDHGLFRDGLRSLLEHYADLAVVGEASDGASAVDLVRDLRPDIVLMDLNLPRLGGVEAIKSIIAEWPTCRIIVLTMYQDDHLIDRAIHAGAIGYILKDSRAAELLEGIRAVAEGRVVLDSGVAARLMQLYRREVPEAALPPAARSLLSERDVRILRYVGQGLTNRQIAQQLFLSEQTVKNILSQLYRKLQVGNRMEAITTALDRGLLGSGSGHAS